MAKWRVLKSMEDRVDRIRYARRKLLRSRGQYQEALRMGWANLNNEWPEDRAKRWREEKLQGLSLLKGNDGVKST